MSLQHRLSAIAKNKPSNIKWALSIPFEWKLWGAQNNVKWDAEKKISYYEGHELPEQLKIFKAAPFSWEWRQQSLLNPNHSFPIELELPEFKAREHQKHASQIIAAAYKSKRVGFLLADDVGVGKTMSAWDFALEQKKIKKILIVTTASALAHWRNTVLHAGYGDKEVLIINYDRLGNLFTIPKSKAKKMSTRKKGKRKRIANAGVAEEFDLIIFDEAHKGRILTSARSIMMSKLEVAANFVIWATATSGQNPLELAYLKRLLAQSSGSTLSSMEDFEVWAKEQGLGVSRGAYGKWSWERDTESLKKMHALLFEQKPAIAIRRLPEDIRGWKSLERTLYPIALSPDNRLLYQKAWEEFKAERSGIKTVKKTKAESSNGLVAQLRFRQKSSLIRIPNTLEIAAEFLEKGMKPAISVAFLETLESIKTELEGCGIRVAQIHGKLSAAEKEKERLKFQKGEADVAVFTVEEAISLHQGEYEDVPRVLLVHDIRWSAIQATQIDGRCHRDGFFSPSYWLFGEGTQDEKIAKVLLSRVISMKTMHGDDTKILEEIETALFG